MLLLPVVRCERRTSLTVNAGCWHALPLGIHATLTVPGCSPRRPESEPATSPDAVTDGGGGADMRRAISADMRGRGLDSGQDKGDADLGILRAICWKHHR